MVRVLPSYIPDDEKLIDDSKTIRKSLGVLLKNTNHTIIEAEDGIIGLAKAFEEMPELIFIDVMMPRIDGFQLSELLKEKEWCKNSILCMLTGKETLLDRAKIKNSNADYLILKPFNTKALSDFIGSIENKTLKKGIALF